MAKLTPLHPKLDPETIYARGFVTKEEAENADISQLSSKVDLSDKGEDHEGIWAAFISKEDRALYDSNSHGKTVRAVLLNHAVNFLPNPTWGRVITGKTNGTQRAAFDRNEQIPRFMETHVAYLQEYPPEEVNEGEAQESKELP